MRGWSHGTEKQVLTRRSEASGADKLQSGLTVPVAGLWGDILLFWASSHPPHLCEGLGEAHICVRWALRQVVTGGGRTHSLPGSQPEGTHSPEGTGVAMPGEEKATNRDRRSSTKSCCERPSGSPARLQFQANIPG